MLDIFKVSITDHRVIHIRMCPLKPHVGERVNSHTKRKLRLVTLTVGENWYMPVVSKVINLSSF